MQLDQMWINPRVQNLYAEIIAIEDIKSEYGIDYRTMNNPQRKGEINNV